MTFDSQERSRDDGQPISLYSFTLAGTVWRYTSCDIDVVAGGFTWKAAIISDDGISQTGQATTDALTIMTTMSLGPVQHYLQTPPSQPIRVKKFAMQRGNTEMYAVYSGEVSQVGQPDPPGSAKITVATLSSTMQRQGLRFGWQRTCPYAVYDQLTCQVNKDDFVLPGVVTDSASGVLTIDFGGGVADSYFNGGFLSWTSPVRGVEYRSIESNTGNVLTMFGPSDDIYPGLVVNCYPGCDQTTDTCINKFNNLVNYGGIKFMPGKSPFDGTPVF